MSLSIVVVRPLHALFAWRQLEAGLELSSLEKKVKSSLTYRNLLFIKAYPFTGAGFVP